MKKFIDYNESLTILSNIEFKGKNKKKAFLTECLGKIVAEDIIAKDNSPELPTSGMDGYAIKFEDQTKEYLEIIDKNPAGVVIESEVLNGTTIKTFTGSLMPKGADTLVPVENVEVKDNKIYITQKVEKGFAVRDIGENYSKGEVLIKEGTSISFAEIGVLASLNIAQIYIYCEPVVSIASTGSEILDIGEEQTNNSQIRSSNHLTVEALAKKAGANTIQLGTVKDDIDNITQVMKDALEVSDIVVTTGGVSKGDYDFVQDVVKDRLDADVLFHGVKVKPGGPVLIAKKENKLIISLPGFAYSSTVCAILFLIPMIYKFMNSSKKLPIVKARIDRDFPVKHPKTVFTACNIRYEDGEYKIDFNGKKQGTSAILTNMLEEPALLIQEKDSSDIKANELVDVLLLDELR